MMTSNFPLLKLPLIPLELVVEKLDFLDLLQLSMKSSKFKRLLELLKLSVCSLHMYVTKDYYMISILRNSNICYIEAFDSIPVDTVTELVNIQGEPVHIWMDDEDEMTVKSALSELTTLETITKYIMSFSKVNKYSLTYDDDETEIRTLLIWQLTTQLDQLKISPDLDIPAFISREDLVFLLEEISVVELHMNAYCPGGFQYQKPIRHPSIYIRYPHWIDFDNFSFGSETITANFSDQKVSNAILNRLIKDWTEGKCPKLRKVKFTWNENDGESLAMAQEYATRPPKPVLPNRNIKQLEGLCINHRIEREIDRNDVFYRVQLSVCDDFGFNGIHLDDQA